MQVQIRLLQVVTKITNLTVNILEFDLLFLLQLVEVEFELACL